MIPFLLKISVVTGEGKLAENAPDEMGVISK